MDFYIFVFIGILFCYCSHTDELSKRDCRARLAGKVSVEEAKEICK